jgi:ParB family transcriptional regulator, chromosome partitioning protein
MAETPKRGLGRGFESLLAPDFDKVGLLASKEDRIEQLAVDQLQANPYQPRKHFEDKALDELAASIKRYGIVQPLVVTPLSAGRYTLIAGERRWRAARKAGLAKVPAIVRSSKELEQLEVALIENVQRVDLSPLEQAVSIERWHEQFSVSYDTIATRLGKATSTVNNIVRLLQLPEAAREALTHGNISEGHARAILALKGQPEYQTHLLQAIIKLGWSVRQAERYVVSLKEGAADHQQARQRVGTETPLTRRLSKRLGAPVRVRRTAKGGMLEIGFGSDKELEQLADRLRFE